MLKGKIEREIYTYMHCVDLDLGYGDICNEIGVSERTFYKYVGELRRAEQSIGKEILYDYEMCKATNTNEKHKERLKRILSIIKLVNQNKVVSKKKWNNHIKNVPERTRQRDFKALENAGFTIQRNHKRYIIEFEY